MEKTIERRQSTLSALRNPNFRLYFAGQMISNSGTWMQNIAQSYLVFQITKSELWLGIVACAAGLPVVLMSPIGGVIVERVPRQTILKFTQFVQMILAFILAALTFSGTVQVWHIMVLALLLGVTNALDIPSRQAIVVEMVGRDEMQSGIALNSIMNSLGRILGPAAAGIALIQFGAAWCFLINGFTFVAVLASLFIMKVPYAIKYAGTSSPLRQLREGIEFARRDPLIPPILLLAGVAGLLVLPILRLLPAVADVILHSPEEAYAALSVGEGTGALISGIFISWLSNRFGHGKLIALAVTINALANILLGVMTSIPLAVLVVSFFGGSMIMIFVSLNTAIQTIVPDNFRGRVLSLYSLAMIGTSPFGALALGAIAEKIGTGQTLILNGILIAVLSGAIILRWPDVIRYRTKADVVTLATEEVLPAVGD